MIARSLLISRLARDLRFLFFAAVFAATWLVFDHTTFLGEAFVHFRYHIAVMAVLGAFGWVKKLHLTGLAAVLICLIQFERIEAIRAQIRSLSSQSVAISSASQDRFHVRVLSTNILGKTTPVSAVENLISKYDADILLVQEFNDSFASMASLEKYPHRVTQSRADDFGSAVFSKFPLTDRTGDFTQRIPVNLSVEVVFPTASITIVCAHLVPPGSLRERRFRNLQLDELAEYALQVRTPVLIAGDFNLTPFADPYLEFLARTGTQDMRAIFGFTPTWPAFIPILWVPIDHVFARNGLRIESVERGPFMWSDHFPLLINVSAANGAGA